MAIRKLKPTSNGHRNMSVSTFEEVTTAKPYKALTTDLKSKAGRNNTGRTTVRFVVAELREDIELSTSKEIRTTYPQEYKLSNTIQTEALISH